MAQKEPHVYQGQRREKYIDLIQATVSIDTLYIHIGLFEAVLHVLLVAGLVFPTVFEFMSA